MPPDIDLTLVLDTPRWASVCPDYETETLAVINATLIRLGRQPNDYEISVVLADDAFIQKHNLQFRGKDKPTNVLSFPADTRNQFADSVDNLGDILISLSTLEREALEQHKTFQDHFTHMLVHGILHLIGYDHQTDDEAEEMESLEIEILQTLGIKNPYNH